MKLLLSLLLLILLTFVSEAQDEQGISEAKVGAETGGDVSEIDGDDDDDDDTPSLCPAIDSQVEPVGNSGKFRFFNGCGEFIVAEMDSIVEVDTMGEPTNHRVNTIANSHGWATRDSGVTRRLGDEPAVTSATFEAELSVAPAVVWMDIELLSREKTTTIDGVDRTFGQGTLELTMSLAKWPCIDPGNTVIITLGISTNNDNSEVKELNEDGDYVAESAKVENAKQAVCVDEAGVENEIDVDIMIKDGDNKVLMSYGFPCCPGGTMVYDPFYTLFHTGNANVVSVWMVCVATMVLSLFSV